MKAIEYSCYFLKDKSTTVQRSTQVQENNLYVVHKFSTDGSFKLKNYRTIAVKARRYVVISKKLYIGYGPEYFFRSCGLSKV